MTPLASGSVRLEDVSPACAASDFKPSQDGTPHFVRSSLLHLYDSHRWSPRSLQPHFTHSTLGAVATESCHRQRESITRHVMAFAVLKDTLLTSVLPLSILLMPTPPPEMSTPCSTESGRDPFNDVARHALRVLATYANGDVFRCAAKWHISK